ncbi:probable envelope ADP,ATP carrier protein, chloroplastic [Tanacetum coccineum]
MLSWVLLRFHVFLKMLKEEGLGSFYRGRGPSLIGIATYVVVNFCVFNLVKKSLPEKFRNRPESSILTAFMAAIIATLTIGLMAMADIAETRNVVANGGKAYYIIRSGRPNS